MENIRVTGLYVIEERFDSHEPLRLRSSSSTVRAYISLGCRRYETFTKHLKSKIVGANLGSCGNVGVAR